jgi:hypothetical protein
MFAKQFPVTALSLHFTAQMLPNNISQMMISIQQQIYWWIVLTKF